jgi:hypothetical protein
MVAASALLLVEWYASFGEMVHGLMKNMFAGVEYSIGRRHRRHTGPVTN